MCVFIRHHRWEKQFSWSFCHEKHFVNGKIHFQFYHVWNWSKNIRISPQKSNIFLNTYFHSVPHMTKNHENSCCSSVPQGKKLILMKFFFIFFTYIFFFFLLSSTKKLFLDKFFFPHTELFFFHFWFIYLKTHTQKNMNLLFFSVEKNVFLHRKKEHSRGGGKGKKRFYLVPIFFFFFFSFFYLM